MVRVKKAVKTTFSVKFLVYHHHGGIVSMKPRVSVALAFRENVVRSGGNALGYQGAELFSWKITVQ